MSSTSGSFGFALGTSGAVIGSQGWIALADKSVSTLSTAITGMITYNTAANTALTPSTTQTTGYAWIKGIVKITTAGSLIPQVSLTQASAAIVGVNSYFKISPISGTSAANITIGNWT
jgi:hypothetical protein